MSHIKELSKLRDDYNKAVKEIGKKAIKEAVNIFFDKYDFVKAIQWEQYTAYFNDGDPCTFGVYADNMGIVFDTLETAKKFCENQNITEEENECFEIRREDNLIDDGDFIEDLDDLINNLLGLEDACLALFGDHVKVVATREGFTAEEYDDHD